MFTMILSKSIRYDSLTLPVCYLKQSSVSLNKELQAIMPRLEDMKKKKDERKTQFAQVLRQISSISHELSGSKEENRNTMVIDENDLSMKRLDDLQNQLLLLQKEKVTLFLFHLFVLFVSLRIRLILVAPLKTKAKGMVI